MLVATDIAARGIDVEELGHVVNFDVPKVPEDYIHRVGRTGRAEAVGDAFTFVSREEEADLQRIERAIGKRLPRVTVPDFDYNAAPTERLEIPLAERLATMRAARRAGQDRRAAGQGQGDGPRRSRPGGSGGGRPAGPADRVPAARAVAAHGTAGSRPGGPAAVDRPATAARGPAGPGGTPGRPGGARPGGHALGAGRPRRAEARTSVVSGAGRRRSSSS